jgi:MtN3 and saliva related transmembrane protein
MTIEALGWASSVVLVLTIGSQVYKQWDADTSLGVSPWLYIGETAASLGFCTYSVIIDNWVFVVTNGILTLYGIVGLVIWRRHKRRGKAD